MICPLPSPICLEILPFSNFSCLSLNFVTILVENLEEGGLTKYVIKTQPGEKIRMIDQFSKTIDVTNEEIPICQIILGGDSNKTPDIMEPTGSSYDDPSPMDLMESGPSRINSSSSESSSSGSSSSGSSSSESSTDSDSEQSVKAVPTDNVQEYNYETFKNYMNRYMVECEQKTKELNPNLGDVGSANWGNSTSHILRENQSQNLLELEGKHTITAENISAQRNDRNSSKKLRLARNNENNVGILRMLENIDKNKIPGVVGHVPRPVLVRTSREEINAFMKRAKAGQNIVFKEMGHSLRFWLAVECNKIVSRKAAKLAKYFDVEVSGLKRAIKDNLMPEKSGFFTPGENSFTSAWTIFKNFGRPEDEVKCRQYIAKKFKN